jgi:DNA polymerase III delta prime subunit
VFTRNELKVFILPSDLKNNSSFSEDVRRWISSAVNWAPQPHMYQPKLLILCGPPGIGKSTMVHLLADELNAKVRRWEDTSQSGQHSWTSTRGTQQADYQALGDGTREFKTSQQDFEEFLNKSSRYSSLALHSTSGKPGPKNATGAAWTKHVIMIETIPWCGSFKSKLAFHNSLSRFLGSRCAHPAVVIYSDCAESQVNPTVLARVFSAEVMGNPCVKVLNCNVVPPGGLLVYGRA